MKFKDRLRYTLCETGNHPFVAKIVRPSPVRRVVEKLPGGKWLYRSGWERLHPFDRQYHIDTSGADKIDPHLANQAAYRYANSYAGAQPGLLRALFGLLPNLPQTTFLDLGCGKGRPLFVATEFAFRAIIGVEFSPRFAEVAKDNALTMARRLPERTRVEIVRGDATAYAFPSGHLVIFLYNPFGLELMKKLVGTLERTLAAESRGLYVIYFNPVSQACFDESPALTKLFSGAIPHNSEEIEFGCGGTMSEENVCIWRGGTAPDLPIEAMVARRRQGAKKSA